MSEPAPLGLSFPNILFQLFNFVVFLGVLYWLLFGPIRRMLEQRRKRIADSLRAAEDLRAQVEQDRAGYEAELAQARSEAQRIREEATRTAESVRARELDRAREDADRVRSDAEAEIERSRAQAAEELRQRTAGLVLAATARVLDRSIDDPEHRRLVDEALRDLQASGPR